MEESQGVLTVARPGRRDPGLETLAHALERAAYKLPTYDLGRRSALRLVRALDELRRVRRAALRGN